MSLTSTARLRLVPVLLAAALAAAACGGSSTSEDEGTSGADQEVSRGGTLTYLSGPEAPGLDPVNLTISTGSGHAPRGYAIYDMLLKLDPETNEVQPGTAESLTSEDQVTWTLTLKPGVTFSDGTPYDAEAVKFNWERHGDPALKSAHASTAKIIKSMDVVDERTLTVTLTKPQSQWPQIVAGGLPFIASPTAVRAAGKDFAAKPVGAGPFTVREWRRDDQLIMDRNPDYHGEEPPLESLIFRPIPDEQQRLDTVTTTPAVARMNVSLFAKRAADAGVEVHETPMNGGPTLIMNYEKAPFDDVRVREALWLAFDRKDYDAVVLQGTGNIPTSYFAPDSPFASDDIAFPEPDLARAQQLVDEYTAEKGELAFTIQTQQPAPAEYLQAAFQTLKGVKVHVQQLAGPQHVGNAFAGDFQATMLGLLFAYPAPVFHEEFRTDGTRNFSNYSDPEVDAALTRAESTRDQQEQQQAYGEVQEQLIADFGEIVLTRSSGLDALGEGVTVPAFWNDGIPAFEQAHVMP